MSQFLRTDRVDGHAHIVYVRQDGEGVTTVDKKHSHTYSGGELTGEDHVHEMIDLVPIPESKKKKGDKHTKVSKVMKAYKEFQNNESEFRKEGKESEEFVLGDQWSDADKTKLEGERRPPLTLNHVAANIRLLSGIQRQNRTDIKYAPVEGGDARIADIYTIVVKNITTRSNFAHEETQICNDQYRVGRGTIHTYIDRDENIQGDIVIEQFPWRDGYLGPHEKFDASDEEAQVKTKWYSEAKIHQLWPKQAKEMQKTLDDLDKLDGEDLEPRHEGVQYAIGGDTPVSLTGIMKDPDFYNVVKKEYRVLEYEEKEYYTVSVIADANEDYYVNAEEVGFTAKDLTAVKTIEGISVIPRNKHRIRRYKVAGATLLEDGIANKSYNGLSLIPMYAEKIGSKIIGKVQDAKDPQREINKRHSQIADILNRVATYARYYDSKTFFSPADEADYKANGSKPGFVGKLMDVSRPPHREEGVRFPSEIANFADMELGQLREIMNINPDILGMGAQATSGIARQQNIRQGLVGNEYLFDNQSFAKKLLGERLVPMIQEVWTPQRIMRLLGSEDAKEAIDIGGEPFADADQAEIQKLLEDADTIKLDVVVDESPYNATKRQGDFADWANLASNRPEVPLEWLLKLSDLPDKEEFMQTLTGQREREMATEQGKQQTEIMKTKIAAEAKTQPDVGVSVSAQPEGGPQIG